MDQKMKWKCYMMALIDTLGVSFFGFTSWTGIQKSLPLLTGFSCIAVGLIIFTTYTFISEGFD